jgi:Flp pilus assembly protein TadD
VAIYQRIRAQRVFTQAEGYLDLEMPHQALAVLNRLSEPGTFRGQLLYLRGKALRLAGRLQEATLALEAAADLQPSNIGVFLALGTCYRNAGQLELAISALQKAEELEPGEGLVQYNLACYFSLSGDKRRSLEYLSRAIARDPHYRCAASEEPDFERIRSDPDFRALTMAVV